MLKTLHEIRDPIHVFIKLDSEERKVVDSRPFQRLRGIHQLALTYLIYPGATHKRFEHSLGVMELAGRVYDVVTNPLHVTDEIRALLPEIGDQTKRDYWRRVLRMAALCHDIGHLPFSHAAEHELLPEGWDHERLSKELILESELKEIWRGLTPPLRAEDIVKLAIGPKKLPEVKFTDWEAVLSEIVVGDAFGVDRIDYLLRDSHHIGVAYGRFDHFRLVDTMRILPPPNSSHDTEEKSMEPSLGVEEGGIHSAEALLLARYFMYSQVYFHPVRRIYDIHLKDFLSEWLDGGRFPTALDQHLSLTDNEINAAIFTCSLSPESRGHIHARRIFTREHFKVLYTRNPEDLKVNIDAARAVYEKASQRYGPERVRRDSYTQKGGSLDFPVLARDGRILSSFSKSDVIPQLPVLKVDYVYIDRSCFDEAKDWLSKNLGSVITLN